MEENYNHRTDVLMDKAVTSISAVSGNLKGLVSDLAQSPDDLNFSPEINRLNLALKSLQVNIEHIVGPFLNDKKKDMMSALEELEVLRTKYKNLQLEWDNQQEHLGRIQGDLLKTRAQLKNQSSFCANLGAIMGSLMWKTSRLPKVVETLLSTNRVSEFLCIVSGSVESFMGTFHCSFPDVTTNETQFIISLVGIVTNMAGAAEGRQFLISDPNGRELITQLLDILPSIPQESGNSFKRVVLMCLYNISISQMGLIMLLESNSLPEELSKDILNESNPELRLVALRLVQSLTMQIPSAELYEKVTHSIPMEVIQKFTNTSDADMRILACSIMTSMDKANAKFGSGVVEEPINWSKCRRNSGVSSSSCSVIGSVLSK